VNQHDKDEKKRVKTKTIKPSNQKMRYIVHCTTGGWASTKEKMIDSRHEYSTMTPDNQQPTTTTDSDTRQSTASTQQSSPDKKQQKTNTDRYNRQAKPTPDNQQSTTAEDQFESSNPFSCAINP
jgi:hypothetical protein